MNDTPQKLKRVVVKEELVELTGNFFEALILNQFLYWSERTKDTDKFLEEEIANYQSIGDIQLLHGWIYKTADDLKEELMVSMSRQTLRKHIKSLVEKGFVDERNSPKYKWDHTLQYRPSIRCIQACLADLGFALDDYPMLKREHSSDENGRSCDENGRTIPESTTETTHTPKREDDFLTFAAVYDDQERKHVEPVLVIAETIASILKTKLPTWGKKWEQEWESIIAGWLTEYDVDAILEDVKATTDQLEESGILANCVSPKSLENVMLKMQHERDNGGSTRRKLYVT